MGDNGADRPEAALEGPDNLRAYQKGDLIGESYRIYAILGGEGKSGIGVVYGCLDLRNGRFIALKTLQEKYLLTSNAWSSFTMEALRWISLEKHPHIVTAYLVFEMDYRHFIECEFIGPDRYGRNTLHHHLRGPISLNRSLLWSIQFCYGMEHAFKKKVLVHGDIKPANIMITKDKTLKITDFGPARTPAWMAPEYFDGVPDVRSDIYAWGVIMYQMAHGGVLPFYTKDREEYEMLHKEKEVPFLDSPLFPVIERCMRKDPKERYRNFTDLRLALEALYGETITAVTGNVLPPPPAVDGFDEAQRINKGVSLSHIGEKDAAIKEYLEAIRLNPSMAESHNNLGLVYQDKGMADDAVKCFETAIIIDPDYVNAYNNLAITLERKGLLDEAIDAYRQALKRNSNLVEVHYNLANALKAKCLLGEAIAEYREALRCNPRSAQVYNNLGLALKEKGNRDEAVRCFKEALKHNPRFADAYTNLGNIFINADMVDEAISCYTGSLKCNHRSMSVQYLLGQAYVRKGRLDDAIGIFTRLIDQTPAANVPLLKKFQEVLSRLLEQKNSGAKGKSQEMDLQREGLEGEESGH